MDHFHQIPFQLTVLTGSPADRTDLNIGVVRVRMLNLVMSARRQPVKGLFAFGCRQLDSVQSSLIECAVVVTHMKRVRMLQCAVFLYLPRLQMFQPDFEVAALRI